MGLNTCKGGPEAGALRACEAPMVKPTSFLSSKEQSKSCCAGKEVYAFAFASPGAAPIANARGKHTPHNVRTLGSSIIYTRV